MAIFGEKVLSMENKFRSLTIFEFQERFPDEDSCYAYLSELKWGTGFVCPNCGHTKYCNGKRKLALFLNSIKQTPHRLVRTDVAKQGILYVKKQRLDNQCQAYWARL